MPKELTRKMDSYQMRFWWNQDHESRRLILRKWDFVAIPKKFGGLNFKKSDIFNIALLARLAWRMLEKPDAPWAIILRHKYFMILDPLTDDLTTHGPWIWRGIR